MFGHGEPQSTFGKGTLWNDWFDDSRDRCRILFTLKWFVANIIIIIGSIIVHERYNQANYVIVTSIRSSCNVVFVVYSNDFLRRREVAGWSRRAPRWMASPSPHPASYERRSHFLLTFDLGWQMGTVKAKKQQIWTKKHELKTPKAASNACFVNAMIKCQKKRRMIQRSWRKSKTSKTSNII